MGLTNPIHPPTKNGAECGATWQGNVWRVKGYPPTSHEEADPWDDTQEEYHHDDHPQEDHHHQEVAEEAAEEVAGAEDHQGWTPMQEGITTNYKGSHLPYSAAIGSY